LRILDRREVQLVVEEHQEHVVGDIELVVLHFVVWTPVLAFSELVIASPIFVAVFQDGGWDGRCVAQVVGITICGIVFVKVRLLCKSQQNSNVDIECILWSMQVGILKLSLMETYWLNGWLDRCRVVFNGCG